MSKPPIFRDSVNKKINERLTDSYTVDQRLHGLLIGKKGRRLKKLTEETGTRIHVERGTDQVMIYGERENIEQAKIAIEKALRQKQKPTHFLSLPIPSVHHQLEAFYSKIDSVDPAAFILPANFHITLGVMSLVDQTEVERAVRYLKEEGSKVVNDKLKGRPLDVKLERLGVMQSNPEKAHVLYIEPQDDTKRLIELCKGLTDKMIEGGFMEREKRELKLHATIINTTHCIIQEYGEINFGEIRLDEIHLMKMGRTGPGKTYESQGYILI
ncbi:hypothetical protein G6F43_007316 [Rhizopus delemar]|nr:hypothetical protein G6F43_007316 [Rhizopus delemar]